MWTKTEQTEYIAILINDNEINTYIIAEVNTLKKS